MNEITIFDIRLMTVCWYKVFINLFLLIRNRMRKGANLCKIQVTSSINPFNILGKIDKKIVFQISENVLISMKGRKRDLIKVK